MVAISLQIERLGTRRSLGAALFSGLTAAVGVFVFWGFTVDDALVTARVAHHIAVGHGYRFNPTGPVVDAVTPLGWAYLLAPFAKAGPLAALSAARWIGVAAWIASAAWLGASVKRRGAAVWPLALLAVLSPMGLWASAGMETAVVAALVTFATARGVPGLCCLGLAAAWRPELIPFAFTLTLARCRSLHQVPRNMVVAIGPAVLAGFLRWACFGSPHPLAVVAKPSDFTHGFWYALEALLWSGPIWLCVGPGWPWTVADRACSGAEPPSASGRAGGFAETLKASIPGWPALERPEAALLVAVLVHFAAVALAGGDWMPAYRLAVPVLPAMLRVACHVAPSRGRVLTAMALLLSSCSTLHISAKLGPSARRIAEQRSGLVRAATRAFRGASVVAAPDVGWVGAAFAGEIVDLAGATDTSVAYMRGGHTSKQIGTRLLVSRRVDHIAVLLAPKATLRQPWTDSAFARAIDHRAAMLGAELGCVPAERLELLFTSQSYLILNCPKL
jgi:hypothetical protein